MMRSNRLLVRKRRKMLLRAALREARRQPVPIFAPMWMNHEVQRIGKKIRERFTRKESQL